MKNTKWYLLLTFVLFFAMSSVYGFCGLGGVIADVASELDRMTVSKTSSETVTSSISDADDLDLAERFFDLASASLVNSSTFCPAAPVQLRLPLKRAQLLHPTVMIAAHFTHHKYFNRSALPFIYQAEPAVNRHYLQRLRILII